MLNGKNNTNLDVAMDNASKIIFQFLTRSFIATAICLLVGVISNDGSLAQTAFGGIGYYGIFATVILFKIHIILWVISLALRKNN